MKATRRSAAVLGTCALAIVFSDAAVAQPQQTRAAAVASGDFAKSFEATTRLVSTAVVQIFATSYAPGEGMVPRTADLVSTQRASGSGVIVDAEGFIVTNAHVVRGATRLRVELAAPGSGQSILATRGRRVSAKVVGMDLETDLAVLKVDEAKLPAVTFGDSDELNAGQLVLAFGSPMGLQNSVSLGVVSAVARQLQPESPMIYVQTDASINPGSSGGPLVDLRGRLVGINTLIVSQAGGNEGLGFAVPSNIVGAVYQQIRKNGRVRRGEIGIRPQTVTPELAAGLGLSRDFGVVLADVLPGSPAAVAGLRVGDLVTALDGKPMENGRQLRVNLYRRLVGDVVNVDVLRDGQPVKFPVAITERDDDPLANLTDAIDPRQNLIPRLGILAVDLSRQIVESLPAIRVRAGVVVASSVAGAIDAREGGLAVGDIIYAINRKPVSSIAELRAGIDVFKAGDSVVLHLQRRGELMFLAFTID
jgi:serine protease Do